MKTFILHWLDCTTTTIIGTDFNSAFASAGYDESYLPFLRWIDEVK